MAIIYVKSGFTGNGTTWNNAFGTLQDAIASAVVGDQIWVAGGTYTRTISKSQGGLAETQGTNLTIELRVCPDFVSPLVLLE